MAADVITGLDVEESQDEIDKRLEFERKENMIRTFAKAGDEVLVLNVIMTVVAIKESYEGLVQFGLSSYTDDELPRIHCMYRLTTDEIKFIDFDYDELQHVEVL